MKVLVVNCGSSSLKYQLIDMETENVMAKGYLEKIGLPDSFLTHTAKGESHKIDKVIKNHEEGMELVIEQLLHNDYGVIADLSEIDAIGHRIVHGGEKFTKSVIVTDEVVKGIEDAIKFAPLHNPAHLQGIYACQSKFPGKPNVVVFDTAFHQTLPEKAYMYPIPYEYYDKYKVRKYGAHGTSHRFIGRRVAEVMGRPVKDLKIVSCHLGQGASLCAISEAKSVETTMGLTPLAGIPMGTRSGDLDPSVVTFLMEKENLTPQEMETILNKKSGKLGLSGVSSDDRDIAAAADEGNARAKLALDNFAYQVAGYIGKLAVQMKGVDVIAFAGGVGENAFRIRKAICEYLGVLGVEFDDEKNKIVREEVELSTPNSKVKVYCIPTNEELMIARDTRDIVSK